MPCSRYRSSCRSRARRHARRIRALVATRDLKRAMDLRERTDLSRLHERAGDAERHLVLALAGSRAGMAADALVLVENLDPPPLLVIGGHHRFIRLAHGQVVTGSPSCA